ncbi:MAG: hypothetical protein L6R41_007000 [Letrouitia leprolyta]|nr:MAG: hypothetical protein L6R41_007000 [Letrouitia leprolyta]
MLQPPWVDSSRYGFSLAKCTKLKDDVLKWITDYYATLSINQTLHQADGMEKLPGVQFLSVVDLVSKMNNPPQETSIILADVDLDVHVFQLFDQPREDLGYESLSRDEDTNEPDRLRAHIMRLPHVDLQNLLIFHDALHAKLLIFLLRMISIAKRQLESNIPIFNRLVLLYGPPGTGKSSLCRALAQKLAIRLQRQYERTELIELDTAALLSKFFGESSKLVSKTFDKIEKMLIQNPTIFLALIIDEIESLAGIRQYSAGANEPKDSMRDSAFLDRIDVKQYIPGPDTRTRYEILRKRYLNLLESKMVLPSQTTPERGEDRPEGPAGDVSVVDGQIVARAEEECSEILPAYDITRLHFLTNQRSAPYKLSRIAEMSAGLSARASFNPTQIFADDVTEEKGENARLSAFVGAIAVGDLVKSTLGPKGMDKILQSASTGEIMVTNDGATILKSIALDNAAAKVLVNISKVQDDEVGDGTTSVAVLAAELLREAEKLVERKLHPQTIIEGYRIASNVALEALTRTAQDHSKDKNLFRKDLLAIARTTLSSKVLSQDRDHFAALTCDAVLRLQGSTDLSHIQIIKKAGGKLNDSYLDEGFILDKRIGVNQPKRLEKAKILVANTAMDTDKVKIFGARVKVDSTGGLAKLEEAEREKMKQKVEKIKGHGINCFVNRQLIYNRPEQLFSDAGIISIEHADFDGIERLALVTGGEIASTFDHPEMVKLGYCDLIEEVIIGEDTLIKFSGVAAGQACTIVLRGATEQLLDEAERSLHDALAVLSQTVREPKTTLGGGCAEMVMAKAVEQEAPNVAGKKAIAVDAFAAALRQLPIILADNAGFDSSDLVAKLKKAIYNGQTNSGLDLLTTGGGIADMREKGVIESYKLKRAVVSSASEAAELLLRVDSIVRCAPRRRERM